jgi:hypothetical protein
MKTAAGTQDIAGAMPMTKEEAHQFKERWKLVSEVTIEEARRTPVSVKLHQLALMYEAGQMLDWDDSLKEDEEVRERWRRLKENSRLQTIQSPSFHGKRDY